MRVQGVVLTGIVAIMGIMSCSSGEPTANNGPSLTNSSVSASSGSITADGASTATITVQLRSSSGSAITSSGGTVVMQSTGGTLSGVTDHQNGSYTATLTAPTAVGSASISAQLNGQALTSTAGVTFVAGAVDLTQSTISAADSVLTADGVSSTVVIVRARDAHGNAVTSSLGVTIATTKGTMGSVVSAGGGVYTASLTSPTSAATGTVSAQINSQPLTATASVRFAAGAVSLSHSTLTVADSVLVASGSATTLVTVQARDVHDNPITTALTVTVLTSAGSVGAVSSGGGGVYSATLTSSTALVTANVSAKINAQALTTTAGVRFKIGPAAQVVVAAGNNQIVPPNKQISDSILLLVSDGFGHAVQSSAVTVAVTTGGGAFLGSTVTSDAQGYATIGTVGAGDWRVGSGLGAQTMTASAHLTNAGSAVVGTATITAQVSGDGFHYDQVFDGASAQANVPWNFTSHLQVRIVDDLTSAVVKYIGYFVTNNTGGCTWDATTLTCPSAGTFTINFQQYGFDGDDNPTFRPQITLTVTP